MPPTSSPFIRQLKFSEKTEQSLDLVLFLNGLPIFTAELKNPLTGQTVENAISQYRMTVTLVSRCLALAGALPTSPSIPTWCI